MSSRTELAYLSTLDYSIWREPDDAKPYILDEHEEGQYDIRILMRLIKPNESTTGRSTREELLVAGPEEVLIYDDVLRGTVDRVLAKFGVRRRSVREEMVKTLLEKILEEAVYPCRCYCERSRGPTIVMEIVELLHLPPSDGFD